MQRILLLFVLLMVFSCRPPSKHLLITANLDKDDIPLTDISGKIYSNNSELDYTSVALYLSGTDKMVKCNESGEFDFKRVYVKPHELTILIPKCRPITERLEIKQFAEQNVEIFLPEKKIYVIGEPKTDRQRIIELTRELNELRRKMANLSEEVHLFNELVVGNPEICKVINPQVITYEKREVDQGFYISYKADEPLLIENRLLGYFLTITIDKASISKHKYLYNIKYSVTTNFSDLTEISALESNQWKANRKHAFEGSFRHFLMALAEHQLEREGFSVLTTPNSHLRMEQGSLGRSSSSLGLVEIEDPYYIVSPTEKEGQYQIYCEQELRVAYSYRNLGNKWNKFWGVTGDYPISTIRFNGEPVRFDRLGNQLDFNKVLKFGYWQSTQISELLPATYFPQE